MYCYACGKEKDEELFTEYRVCRLCGGRMCDDCYDFCPFCCIQHRDRYVREEIVEHCETQTRRA